MLDRKACADYVRKQEQKPGVNRGALLWALIILTWALAVGLAWLL